MPDNKLFPHYTGVTRIAVDWVWYDQWDDSKPLVATDFGTFTLEEALAFVRLIGGGMTYFSGRHTTMDDPEELGYFSFLVVA